MTGNTHIFAVSVALLTAATGAGPAQAYALEGPKWTGGRAQFDYVVPGAHSALYSAALKQAMVAWNKVSAFRYAPINASSNPCAGSGRGGAGFSGTACGRAFGSTVLAITFYDYTGGNRFIHAGTVFNSHVKYSVYTGALRPGVMDFRRVAVHELGHALGLDHETNPNIPAIMYPTAGNIEKPQPDDIAGVRALYGR